MSGERGIHHIQYNWINGAETLDQYKPGGYDPMLMGDVLHEQYRILGLWGLFDRLGYGFC